jgi:Zn-dependent protease/CBS domain-containing protein
MSWSWKLGRIAGIPIYVHWTFVILMVAIVVEYWARTNDLMGALAGAGSILALFGCVVLHELGHALMARRFGVPTADITLLPIGGVARLQRIPERPVEELWIALAGPAVNVLIVAGLYLAGVRLRPDLADAEHLARIPFWPQLLLVNVFLAGFNLLPAFPMDGGRVLRAVLAMRLPYARATRIAASVGQLMAIGFGLMGLSSGAPMLLLIALFVWIGAEAEASQVEERVALRNVPVAAAMITEFHTLRPDDTLGHAADLLLAGTQQNFPVGADEGPVLGGVLTRADLMAGLASGGREAAVSGYARAEIPRVEAASPLAAAVARLRQGKGPCLEVVDRGRTVGLLTLENVGEFLMVQAALGERSDTPGRRPIEVPVSDSRDDDR